MTKVKFFETLGIEEDKFYMLSDDPSGIPLSSDEWFENLSQIFYYEKNNVDDFPYDDFLEWLEDLPELIEVIPDGDGWYIEKEEE